MVAAVATMKVVMFIDGIDGTSTYAAQVTIVYINVDGKGGPDVALSLLGTGTVTANDFIVSNPSQAPMWVLGGSGYMVPDHMFA